MKKYTFLLLFFLGAGVPSHANPLRFQKGISLPLYSKNPSFFYEPWIEEIRGLGATNINIVFELFMEDISSISITANPLLTPTPSSLRKIIQKSHDQGLQVMLFPILRLRNPKKNEWRGVLAPKDLNQWFQSYHKQLSPFIRLAQKEKVGYFCVGSELCSLERYQSHWQDLIQYVRKIYFGQILYSANWDHYREVSFWNDLDLIGVNAYWELTNSDHPTLNGLEYHLKKEKHELLNWHKEQKRPLILTEVGYQSRNGSNRKPWNSHLMTQVDLYEQSLCYLAFYRVWKKTPQLSGVYFWHYYGEGGPFDGSYTPRGKPAAEILSHWFLNSEVSPPRLRQPIEMEWIQSRF